MTGYNFTQRVRKVLELAREETSRLGHSSVSPDHLLLGLAREGGGVATDVARNLGTNLEALAASVESRMEPREATPLTTDLPYTSRAKKVLELSMDQAGQFGHRYVGTEHLFIAIAREEKSVAARALTEAGLSVDRLRAETLRLLGESGEAKPESSSDFFPLATAGGIPRPIFPYGINDHAAHRIATRALTVSLIALLVAVVALVVSL